MILTEDIKKLQVELSLAKRKFLCCSDLSKAFNHNCRDPVRCYLSSDGIFYFLCHTHSGLKRMEFKRIRNLEDLE